MGDQEKEKIIFEHFEDENKSSDKNVHNSDDVEKINQLTSINPIKIEKSENEKKDETENVKELKKSEETVEISKFAEDFVDPIMKEAIAMHKNEIEDEINDIPCEFSGDKKSDKSSSDDGFEYVKKEEVTDGGRTQEEEEETNEGEEVKRELEDVVFQEELRLESASEDITSGLRDDYESDDVHEDVLSNQDSFVHSDSQEIVNVEDNDKDYITNVETEDHMESVKINEDYTTRIHDNDNIDATSNDYNKNNEIKNENIEIKHDFIQEKQEEFIYLKEENDNFQKDYKEPVKNVNIEVEQNETEVVHNESELEIEHEEHEVVHDELELEIEHEEHEVEHEEHENVEYNEPEIVHYEPEVEYEKDEMKNESQVEEPLEKVHFVPSVFAEPLMDSSYEHEKIPENILLEEKLHEEQHNIKSNEEINVVDELNIQSDTSINEDVNNKCKDIISWVHPISSAIAFSILMFIELGLMMEYSIISILAYSGLLLMIASFLYKIAVNFKLINTQSSKNCIITFNKSDIEHCVHATLSYVDYFHKEIKSIAYVESYMKNMKVFVLLWVLTYVGQMFNLQSLIFIGSLLLFSMPVLYTKFDKEINEVVDKIRGQVNGVINKIKCSTQRVTGKR